MRTSLFRKTAWTNIRKNYRFFVPRMLAEAGLLACFYISITLASDERLKELHGGAYVASFMSIGTVVLGLLSAIIMLYANSFLMKQRKSEFGLYNVLGMEKRHIGRILFHENMIAGLSSIILGTAAGVLMYKLCALLICKILKSDVILGFDYIKPQRIALAAGIFLAMDLAIFIIDRISIARLKPVELLKSRTAGEREPKVKKVILALGIACLVAGYTISIIAGSPLSAMNLFFPAVFLVIFGTYFLLVSGSIFVLKMLKKNKNYYYNKNHFASVSGLLYRMKQNAVGLASIAILATGVLVMVSTTVSLYYSMDDTIAAHYPEQVYLTAASTVDGVTESLPEDGLEQIVREASVNCGLEIASITSAQYLEIAFARKGNVLNTDRKKDGGTITDFIIITEEMYRTYTGETLNLSENNIAICNMSGTKPLGEKKLLMKDLSLDVTKELPSFPISSDMVSSVDTYGMVVPNNETMTRIFDIQKAAYGEAASVLTDRVAVKYTDINAYAEKDNELRTAISQEIAEYVSGETGGKGEARSDIDTMESARIDVLGVYGSFLFLGIILGIVCLFATALIVYYKQISEGYEDRERFQIMKKVGMSDQEVKRSIRSQILTVFFLPLIVAGVHMCFAFPMLEKLMTLLLLSSTMVFIQCSVVVFLAFALVYVSIYSVTAKSYYKIIR